MSIYQNIYNLIANYVFANAIDVGSNAELVCMLVSTIACLFVIALPFLVVWRVIRLFF